MGPSVNKRRRKRDNAEAEANAPPNVLRNDHAPICPEQGTRGGKSLAAMGLEAGSTFTSAAQETPTDVSDPELLSYVPAFPARHCPIFQNSGHRDPCWRYGYYREVRLLKKARAQVARRNERIQVREEEIKRLGEEVESLKVVETEVHGLCNQTKNLETLLEAEVDMKKTTEAKNAELAKKLESLCAKFSDLQLNNNQPSQQVSTLQAQVTSEERIKVVFEEFKKYEDDKVEKRCAEIDARLDALSIDFDEEFSSQLIISVYPEVRDPKDPWACKEEILLGDAIAANISRAEKKKKFRVILPLPLRAPCHPALQMLTQTDISEDEASSRLLRSKSLPPMYNLDWP
ncbi:hypothetical protein Tco_0722843 [Tanacetum coccineum]